LILGRNDLSGEREGIVAAARAVARGCGSPIVRNCVAWGQRRGHAMVMTCHADDDDVDHACDPDSESFRQRLPQRRSIRYGRDGKIRRF
jgi:hypothetical protein